MTKKRRLKKINIFRVIIYSGVLVIVFMISAIFAFNQSMKNDKLWNLSDIFSGPYFIYRKDTNISIAFTGDIMSHMPQVYAHQNSNGTYDFTRDYRYVKEYFDKSDYLVGNLETTLAGKDKIYTGFPLFNSPEDIVDSLVGVGFDLINIANNHIYDRNDFGYYSTIKFIKEKKGQFIGGKEKSEDNRYIIKSINDIKIGFASYVEETESYNGNKTINGIHMSKEVGELLNTYNTKKLDSFYAEAEASIKAMKESGAEVIIYMLHWGVEYSTDPTNTQKAMVQKLSDLGVDLVMGHHPHVLQPIEIVHSDVSNKDTIVAYSLGNFVSNQTKEMMGSTKYTENGMMIFLNIEKDWKHEITTVIGLEYMPTWLHYYKSNDTTYYDIIPMSKAINDNNAYSINASWDGVSRLNQAYSDAKSIITRFISNDNVLVTEKK